MTLEILIPTQVSLTRSLRFFQLYEIFSSLHGVCWFEDTMKPLRTQFTWHDTAKKTWEFLLILINDINLQLYVFILRHLFLLQENCTSMALKCYMLEFQMVLDEEEVNDAKATCIFAYNKIPRPDTVSPVYKIILGQYI